MIITPFLAVVLAGFAAFVLVLGTVSARQYIAALGAARVARGGQDVDLSGKSAPSARQAKADPAVAA